MAQKIVVGLSTYLESFATGQSGLRTPPYTQYSPDHDTNYVTLRTTINSVIDELAALSAPTATLGLDTMVFNDPARGGGVLTDGLIGLHSFLTTIGAPTSELDVQAGDALVGAVKVSNVTGATKVSPGGGASTHYIAIDANGTIFLETAAAQRALDLYSAVWDGAAYTSVTRVAEVMFDGDEYEALRTRPATGTTPVTFSALKYAQANRRLAAVERILAGLTTDAQGNALGQPAVRAGSAATPGLVVVGSTGTGIYGSTTTLSIATAGVSRFTISSASLVLTVPTRLADGTAAAVAYGFSSGAGGVGLYRPGTNRLGFATSGVQAGEFDVQGNLDLTLNSRVKGSRTAVQSINDVTDTLVDFSASDEFDVGLWHDNLGTLAQRQEFTVPTGDDGIYLIVAKVAWATVAAGLRRCTVTVGGVATDARAQVTAAGVWEANASTVLSLVAGNVVRLLVRQESGGAINLTSARLSIVKVA